MRRNFWREGRVSFKSFRSDFDIRSHAETVVQALSTRRVYLMRYVRAAIFVLNIRTLFMCALACVIVYLCESSHMDLRFRQDFSIISVGTIFPLVFAIQQAFTRREDALKEMAFLKAQLMGIYFCNRDWDISDGLLIRANLGNDSSEHALRCQQLILKFLNTLKQWLVSNTVYESESERRSLEARGWLPALMRGESQGLHLDAKRSASFTQRVTDSERADTQKQLYYQCYHYLSQLNVLNETLTAKANYPKAGEGGMSRLAQYIAKSTEALEKLRYLREYRTPFMLRYVSFILILVSLFLMSPYFAFMCVDSKWEQDHTGSCPAGYVTACLYVVVVCTLYGVQVALENPFDGEGMDDVYFDLPREFEETMQRYSRSGNFHKASAGTIVGNSVYVLGSSGIPPTGYSNYPGGLTGIGSGPATDFHHVTATMSVGGASHAMGQQGPPALSPANTLAVRPSMDTTPPPHLALLHGHQASLRRNAMVQQAAAAAGAVPHGGGGEGHAAGTRATGSGQQQAAAAADMGGSRHPHTAPFANGDARAFDKHSDAVGTGGDGSSVCGDGGSGYPAPHPAGPPPPVLLTNATFAGARCPQPTAPIARPQEQQASRLGPPSALIVPNGHAGPGYIGTAAAGGGGTAASSGISPFCEPGFQSIFLTAGKLEQQQQQQLATPSANAAALSRAAGDRRPGSSAATVAAAEHIASPPFQRPSLGLPVGADSSTQGLPRAPFQRPSLGLPVGADSSTQGLPRAPFQRPSLGVPVGAATVGLTDPHTLLVAGGSGPGIIMQLSGNSPAGASSGNASGAGHGGGRYRMQQHSARTLAGARTQQLLPGGSPVSTVPGTPLVPRGSHGTSLTGMHGVNSRTSLGGAVLFAMDQEGGAMGPAMIVPSMPRGDADSPTAQDAIEAALARGLLGNLHVSSGPHPDYGTPHHSPPM
ncbi:hypothetical protein HXX76_007469 [Chlamydomonas incerta]|uniref:Uncharacterized protein n=1 Tax=Chlamydomonas incerta TaxID=51695 RepID=A0A835SY02_CHLIN|nr:hypothetical protein HXX76_007469 [Chlamydomonas incerta]|eukprot:KAG2435397.1 hypothetical protein HXX76_007469 [Chlamydomonas incerta]